MGLLTTAHGRADCLADFVPYAAASAALATLLAIVAPGARRLQLILLSLLGLVAWTLLEYVLHRFVLHGLRPFSTWHAEHHRRPRARIGMPILLNATLVALLVFAPLLLLGDLWGAAAASIGLLTGYLVYAIVHNATHHRHVKHAWRNRLKRQHALHHGAAGPRARYGVTSAFWDRVFGTVGRRNEPGPVAEQASRDSEGLAAWENEGGAPSAAAAGTLKGTPT